MNERINSIATAVTLCGLFNPLAQLPDANISITDRFYRGTNEDQIKQDVLAAMDGAA